MMDFSELFFRSADGGLGATADALSSGAPGTGFGLTSNASNLLKTP